jgi:nicotinic acid phosphoribosyltransferase
VLYQIHLQTVLASKAVRVVTAAQGRPVVDSGARRMHGIDLTQTVANRECAVMLVLISSCPYGTPNLIEAGAAF